MIYNSGSNLRTNFGIGKKDACIGFFPAGQKGGPGVKVYTPQGCGFCSKDLSDLTIKLMKGGLENED